MVGGCVSTKAPGTVSCSVPRDGCGSCACQSADRCDCLGVADVLEPLISRLHGGTDADPKGRNPFWFPKLQAIRSQSTAALYQCESDDESSVRVYSCSMISTNLFGLFNDSTTQQPTIFIAFRGPPTRMIGFASSAEKEQLQSAVTARHTNEQQKSTTGC